MQGLLEMAGVAYCGPNVAGSAAAMDKGLAKALLAAAGLPQARYLAFRETDLKAGTVDRVEPSSAGRCSSSRRTWARRSGYPGSRTLVAWRLHSRSPSATTSSWLRKPSRARSRSACGLAEPAGVGAREIKPSHDFYDFEDKYMDGSAGLEVPARLPDGVAEEIGRLAVAACRPSGSTAWREWTSSTKRVAAACSSTRSTPFRASPPSPCTRECGPRQASPTTSWSTSWSTRLCGGRPGGPGGDPAHRLTGPGRTAGAPTHMSENR